MTRPITLIDISDRLDELGNAVAAYAEESTATMGELVKVLGQVAVPDAPRQPILSESRRDLLRRFTSRKFVLAVFGPVLVAVANWLGIDSEYIALMVTVIVAFILGESGVDIAAARKGHQPAPAPAVSPPHLETGER